MLIVTHPVKSAMDSLILVTYEICEPQISVHTPMSTSAILCPNDLLNLGVTAHAVVCMHNTTNVCSYFMWGEPVGNQENSLAVQFFPTSGMINPGHVLKVSVALTPLQAGILDQVYVPCFVGRTTEPVVLTVMCAVDNIHICFKLPTQDGRYRKVKWPPKIINEFNRNFSLTAVSHEELVLSVNIDQY